MFIFWFKRIIWGYTVHRCTGIRKPSCNTFIVLWGCNRCSNRCSNSAGHSPMFWECHVSHHRTQYLGWHPQHHRLGLRHGIAVQRWSRQNSEILTCAFSDSRRTPQNHHVYITLKYHDGSLILMIPMMFLIYHLIYQIPSLCSLWYPNTLCCWFGHDISKDCRPSWTLIASWCWHRCRGSVMISG